MSGEIFMVDMLDGVRLVLGLEWEGAVLYGCEVQFVMRYVVSLCHGRQFWQRPSGCFHC